MEIKSNPLENIQELIKSTCYKLGLDDSVYQLLKDCQRLIEITIPIKMDNGRIETFKGYRVLHNNVIGPGKGGIRFHPNLDINELKALSIWMTLKSSIIGIPYGGAKGGILLDPTKLSRTELERLSRGYVQGLYPYLGEQIDIPAPDINTNSQIIACMVDEYIKLSGKHSLGTFTDKPQALGGSQARDEATGLGVAIIAKETDNKINLRKAAYIYSIQKIADTMKLRGWY